MARGAEGDCPEQHPKNMKRKRARALKLWFFSLFLCCVKAPVEDTVEVGQTRQKTHGAPNTTTNTTATTTDNPQKALTRKEIKRRVKVGKARWEEQRRKKKRAWYSRLLPKLKMPKLRILIIPKPTYVLKATKFVKKTEKPTKMTKIQDASTTTRPYIDDCATKADPSPKETASQNQDERPKEPPTAARNNTEACPGTVVERMVKKDPKRLIDHTNLENTLKAMEALADLVTRTERTRPRKTKKDLESHPETTQGRIKVVARRTQSKNDLESHPAVPIAWRRDPTRRAAKRNLDGWKHLSQLLVVVLLIVAWFCTSSTLSSAGD
ncbi:uncharacterized protein LOC134454637 [Engraulis encrasicolus]|uniref:uncharacterized protein LOC134454637 n=1 Tax=Engraulis encrasicolus TaxID=184585 RepID=UPI002FD3B77C